MANERIQSLVTDLKKAFSRLKEALLLSKTLIHRDAVIQRFELVD